MRLKYAILYSRQGKMSISGRAGKRFDSAIEIHLRTWRRTAGSVQSGIRIQTGSATKVSGGREMVITAAPLYQLFPNLIVKRKQKIYCHLMFVILVKREQIQQKHSHIQIYITFIIFYELLFTYICIYTNIKNVINYYT